MCFQLRMSVWQLSWVVNPGLGWKFKFCWLAARHCRLRKLPDNGLCLGYKQQTRLWISLQDRIQLTPLTVARLLGPPWWSDGHKKAMFREKRFLQRPSPLTKCPGPPPLLAPQSGIHHMNIPKNRKERLAQIQHQNYKEPGIVLSLVWTECRLNQPIQR